VEIWKIKNRTYKLLAVIEYQGTSDSVGHYIANIRRLTGKWEIHNDLCRDKKPLLASQRVMLQKKNYLYWYMLKHKNNIIKVDLL